MPRARYRIWLLMPSREPSAAPPSRTTIGCSVNGTGVNGSGMLTCAATIVRTVTNSTAAARKAAESSARVGDGLQQRAGRRSVRYGCSWVEILLYAYSTDNRGQRLGRRRRHPGGPEDVRRVRRLRHERHHGRHRPEHPRRHGVGAGVDRARHRADRGGRPAICRRTPSRPACWRRRRSSRRSRRRSQALDLPNLVVDPVMIAKGGDRLLREDAVAAIKAQLLKLAEVRHAERPRGGSAGRAGRSRRSTTCARRRGGSGPSGPRVVVVKGGHLDATGDQVDRRRLHAATQSSSCVAPGSTRGTRTGRAARSRRRSAAQLALGQPVEAALRSAREYLEGRDPPRAAASARGHGPLNHFWRVY